MEPYKKKYLKYKSKYLLMQSELEQEGGTFPFTERTDIYPVFYRHKFQVQAAREGKELLDTWLSSHDTDIKKITDLFEFSNGKYRGKLSATTFSDYYKWTMMPVIWHLHTFITAKNSEKTFRVTFGIDIRDKPMRDAINKDNKLRIAIQRALQDLSQRKFKREELFDRINDDKSLLNKTLNPECIKYICGEDPKNPRSLAKDVTYDETGRKPDYKDNDEDVHIYFYKVDGTRYNLEDTENGLWFIEARGPWPRVTWLETSMMQAVYEAYLRYNLDKLANEQKISLAKAYERWLYGALLRCAKSVAFTRLVQKMDPLKPMTPALFTGRRTGGYIFLLLQNLFFAHHFNQSGMKDPNPDKTICLGTSSVDCFFELNKLGLHCLRPAGTHAHELSMVISVLFPYFDKNKYDLPLTQIIGHELYRTLSANPRSGPLGVMFPMLPDTLGTAAFMKAANWVKAPMPDEPSGKGSFIKLISSARQDSGKLENFKKLMVDWNYKKGMMASEIDDTETLYKATDLGYTTSGAGGFYGDSVKVWNPYLSNPSMAVKAVNVEYCIPEVEKQFYRDLQFPHIDITKLDKGHIMGYPIKIGDPEDMANPALAEGKLSLDKTLPAPLIERIKKWASDRRVRAFSDLKDDNKNIKADSLNIDDIINSATNEPITTNLAAIRR